MFTVTQEHSLANLATAALQIRVTLGIEACI
jgi:hypothetical protein